MAHLPQQMRVCVQMKSPISIMEILRVFSIASAHPDVYVAQVIPQIDAEIAEKGHFWMETS
jgi:hypothetical protein